MITREELYELVWSTPMIKVAEKFDVSGSYLARVCTALRVPRPERGYWAKLAVGKAPERPTLPEPQPGDPIVWSRTDEFPAPTVPKPRPASRPRVLRLAQPVTGTHGLVRGAKEYFLASRKVDEGEHLKPYKKLLVDVTASRSGLDKALGFANDLFNALESAGRVVIGPADAQLRRERVYEKEEAPRQERQHDPYGYDRLWSPYRPTVVGTIGGGKAKPTGKIDIAVMQSLSRQGEVNPLVEGYGQVTVDECHHVGAVSFDAILKRTKAKFVLGLTATPIRRDGQQPIIFMQCGPIRYAAAKPMGAPHDLDVVPRLRQARIDLSGDAGIQDVFRHLANDQARTEAIAAEARDAFAQGRKVLILTERTEHLDAINAELDSLEPRPFVLHGRMSRKQRAALVAELDAVPPDASRILLATGKLVGEGFDHPPLDTLVLAMPVSWKGTLQQYAGRLHREHASKTDVRIIDFVDTGHPALLRMWDKRQRGYRAMGYRIGSGASSE